MTTALPHRADIVIIGGGIIGCSIAYHLAKRNAGSIVLLERKRLTSGTTWHAAGLLGLVRPSENQTKLLQYAASFFPKLEDETGLGTGYVRRGTIYTALNAARLEVLQRTIAHANYLGISDARMISNAELADRWPLMRNDDILGATFVPGTGQVNPVDATQALAKGARMAGVKIVENTAVKDVMIRKGSVIGVRTSDHEILAPIVILASGMWTRTLGAKIGVNVPLHAAEHFYIVSEPIPGLTQSTPSLFIADERAYYKEDAGKLLIGTFEKDARPWATDGIPEQSEFETLPVEIEHYSEFLEYASNRIPALETAGVRTFFSGPESFTPDGREYMGETPDVRGLFVCAGFNSHGIMASAGAGRVMAEWITTGSAPLALASYDIRRAMPFQSSRRYLLERTKESLGLVMDVPWPGKQMVTARGVRRFPVHRQLLEAGAEMGERYGWEVPLWYWPTSERFPVRDKMGQQDWFPLVREECRATREGVALYDQSNYAKYIVQGRASVQYLNWLCANDVDVPVGVVVYTQWLNARGGIEADLTVSRMAEDEFFIVSAPPSQIRDVAWFRRHLPDGMNVTITDVTSAYAMFGLMGPKSRDLLQALTDTDLSSDSFSFATWQKLDIGYSTARASRLTFVGELGYEIIVSSDMADYLYGLLIESGRQYGLRPAGNYALASCRIERGYRHFGHDLTEDDTPNEAGLSFAVSLKKEGGFLGKEALIEKHQGQPPEYRLVQVRLQDVSDETPVLQHNEIIWRNGIRVGSIRSGAWGFHLNASLGIGYVRNPDAKSASKEWIESGDYEIEVGPRKHRCIVQLPPFYDPKGIRVKM
jgi:glycine cleavage system aminomethyltransferase T/glycine/D-amino acid oxidase-like deaminating enzyme